MPTTPTLGTLGEQLSQMVGHWTGWHEDFQSWLTVAANGGVDSNGTVYLRPANPSEAPLPFPSLAKLQSIMLRGFAAANDIVCDFPGGVMGPGEHLRTYIHAGEATSIDAAKCVGVCATAPAADAVISITKNGAAWATVTYPAGLTTPTFSFVNTSLAHGDVLRFFAPATYQASFTSPSFTLAGSIA